MRIKTIIIILITVLLTAILMQNTGKVAFEFLWATFYLSKLIGLAIVAIIGFILGILVGRPKKVKRLGDDYDSTHKTDTLSNEDKDYIS